MPCLSAVDPYMYQAHVCLKVPAKHIHSQCIGIHTHTHSQRIASRQFASTVAASLCGRLWQAKY